MIRGKHMKGQRSCYIEMTAMQLMSVCTKIEKLLQSSVLIDHKCCVLLSNCTF